MLTNKIFNASALRKPASRDLCFLANISLLTSKRIFAFYQMYICLLSNIFPFIFMLPCSASYPTRQKYLLLFRKAGW